MAHSWHNERRISAQVVRLAGENREAGADPGEAIMLAQVEVGDSVASVGQGKIALDLVYRCPCCDMDIRIRIVGGELVASIA